MGGVVSGHLAWRVVVWMAVGHRNQDERKKLGHLARGELPQVPYVVDVQ